jgi:hypothetical protein
MVPTNNKLFQAQNMSLAGTMTPVGDIEALILTWQKLHLVRSLFPMLGSGIGMVGAFSKGG